MVLHGPRRRHEAGAARGDRLCVFCTANVVEDGTHFLASCPAWARQRARLTEFLREELDGVKAKAVAQGVSAIVWWESLTAEAQADLLVAGPLSAADSVKWSRANANKICQAMGTAFNRVVARMWRARPRRAEALADAAAPIIIDHLNSANGMPHGAVGADGQSGAA